MVTVGSGVGMPNLQCRTGHKEQRGRRRPGASSVSMVPGKETLSFRVWKLWICRVGELKNKKEKEMGHDG